MSDVGFCLHARKRANARCMYYIRFKSPWGEWRSGVPSGKTNEDAARRWAVEQIETGNVPNSRGRIPTLHGWAAGFFGVDGRYDRAKRAWCRKLLGRLANKVDGSQERWVIVSYSDRRSSVDYV